MFDERSQIKNKIKHESRSEGNGSNQKYLYQSEETCVLSALDLTFHIM